MEETLLSHSKVKVVPNDDDDDDPIFAIIMANVSKTTKSHIPCVVEFAYHDLRESEKVIKNEVKYKWSAKCNICEHEIIETLGTTTSFGRYVL